MVGAIKGCTGQEPILVGKPSPLMIDYLEFKYGIDKSRVCMVGDRLDTDVLFGKDNGLKSVLVLSGVTSEEKLEENEIEPDFYCDDITKFFELESLGLRNALGLAEAGIAIRITKSSSAKEERELMPGITAPSRAGRRG